jgi:hypothetical protein
MELLNVVLDEVVQNPDWLIKASAGESSMLETAVDTALSALQKVPEGRISSRTAQNVMEAVLKAVALRKDLLDEIPVFGGHKKEIAAALELIIDTTMSDTVGANVRWNLGRAEVFNEIVSIVLSKISETGVTEDILLKVKKVLDEAIQFIATGKQLSIELLITSIKNISIV